MLNAVERISLYEHWEQSVYASITRTDASRTILRTTGITTV